MFTVLHDAAHRSLSTIGWVNATLGRAAMVFVSPAMAFPAWSFIHLEHHRWANDPAHDPDSFASSATGWQTPLRWLFMDGPYVAFYTRHRKGRPRSEVVETSLFMVFTVGLIVTTALTGTFWLLLLVYLIPERIALFVLAWWFDWLPHHGLTSTQRANRYRATRVRVGMEWLFTPLTLSQNYHLVHHLHPSMPFHRYSATWRRNQEAYLDREVAIATVFGRQLTSDEFLEWKELNRALLRLVPVRSPKRTSSHPEFHRLRVRSVEALTADSVVISFDVPPELRAVFRFQAGQHVTVRTDIGGTSVRRNYSICTPATEGEPAELAIGVRHVDGGTFSTFAVRGLKAGDTLDVMTPTGSFGSTLDSAADDRAAKRRYVAIAAGSGITPILSMLQTALAVEATCSFTLIYGNRGAETTMFKDTLERLQGEYGERLEVFYVYSRHPGHPPRSAGTSTGTSWSVGSRAPLCPRRSMTGSSVAPSSSSRLLATPWSSILSIPTASTSSCSTDPTRRKPRAWSTPERPSPCACRNANRPSTSLPATASSRLRSWRAPTHPTRAWVAPAAPARRAWSPEASKWTTTSP